MLLTLIVSPPAPPPTTNTGPLNTSPMNGVTPLSGLPTNAVTSADTFDAPAIPTSAATPTPDENLPPGNVVSEPSAEDKLNPLPPVPAYDLMPNSASTVDPDSEIRNANELASATTGCPTAVTSKSPRFQGEQATTGGMTSDPVIERSSETIKRAADETGDASSAGNSPAKEAIIDAVPFDSLETINDGLLAAHDAEAATSGVIDESTVERERPSPTMTRLTEEPKWSRFASEQYRHFITSVSSSGTGTDEFSPDEFGRGSTPFPSIDSRVSDNTSSAADSLRINADTFGRSRRDISESSLSPEHRKKEETAAASSASLLYVHPLKVPASAAGAVSDQLAAALVERLDAAHDSTPSTFRLRLDPRELGTVEVHLSVVHDVVSIRFVAQDEAARQIIERQLDDLRQSLTNSGVSFSQCHVDCNADDRHPPDQQEAAPPSISRTSPVVSHWSRLRDHELQMTLPQGRLNFVA